MNPRRGENRGRETVHGALRTLLMSKTGADAAKGGRANVGKADSGNADPEGSVPTRPGEANWNFLQLCFADRKWPYCSFDRHSGKIGAGTGDAAVPVFS